MAQVFAKRAGLIVAGTGIYAGVAGLTYLYMTAGQDDQLETERKVHGENFSFVSNPERNAKYDALAAKYDYLIGTDERFMGMNILRKQLLYWHARGTVLEVAAGTGRNSSFFPSTVDRVILADTSEKMLEQARRKIADLGLENPKFATVIADGQRLAFDDNSFDTVLDTFGLCSFDDPVAVLNEMERVCKPDGKILLLEHGRSKNWSWITDYLDKTAERHAKNWGCVYNRDLDKMIEDSGLELVRKITWHFGTTYYLVCRTNKAKKTNPDDS